MPIRTILAASSILCTISAAASAQTITNLVNQPPRDGVIYGFLMTDGTVLYQGGAVFDWYKLTPDAYGSYQNGTWSAVANMPAHYGPYATGGNVLPDGRLLITGGEYLLTKSGRNLKFRLATESAVYDPQSNAWTTFQGPKGWVAIGDSPGVLLPNGQFLIGDKLLAQDALLDARTLKWTITSSSGKADINAEEGWTLMPDGTVLTTDVTDAPNSERLLPSADGLSGEWVSDGSTQQILKFTWLKGSGDAHPIPFPHGGQTYYYKPAGEIGPALLRPDGTVFATGALETKPVMAKHAHTAIYHPGASATEPGTWVAGPDFQGIDDAGDEFAVLLPNGNVLVETNTDGSDDDVATRVGRLNGLMQKNVPMSAAIAMHAQAAETPAAKGACGGFPVQTYHLYEFDGSKLMLEPVDVTTCGNSLNLLGLPTGETIVGGVGLYTSATGHPAPDWAPAITSVPRTLSLGGTYTLSGRQLTGLSQANAYGDEFPAPTNYPLVRLTNDATGHVFYLRTHDWSNSGVATGKLIVSTAFDVSDSVETGGALLEVVANGIPSRAVHVVVH